MSESRISRLANLVSDGIDIDWDRAERDAAGKEELRDLRGLRDVAKIAEAHRHLHPEGELRRWGPLELKEKIGEGAHGEIWAGRDPRVDREVVLKLRKESVPDRGGQARSVSEARRLARIRHPNVVTVYGAEVIDGHEGIWIERISGRTLEEALDEQGPFGAREATLVGIELCRALAAIHATGLVHGDVKGPNVMRAEGGRIVLMDFSSSRELDRGARIGAGVTPGTPLFMAPEMFRGEAVTARSDLYGLGVLLFHLVTDRFPVEAANVEELREKHRRGEALPMCDLRPDVPGPFARVLNKALASSPEDRYESAGAMEQALAATLGVDAPSDRAPRARRSRAMAWLAAAAVVVAAATVAIVLDLLPAGKPYDVQATLLSGQEVAASLADGDRITVGDSLSLEFQGSVPLWVYVVNQDARGESWLLFPLPHTELANPLPPDVRHRLPGKHNDKQVYWEVSSAGGREQFVVLASPERIEEFESDLYARAAPDRYAPLGESAEERLRGIGRTVEGQEPSSGAESPGLVDVALGLAGESRATRGVWIRRIELNNP